MKKIISFLILMMFVSVLPVNAEDKERINIYYNNGVTYFKDKKYSSAILEFKKVLRARPYDKTVQNALAMAYFARAQYYTDSEKAYKKAINDLRSGIVYLKYWDSELDENKAALVKKSEDTLDYLKRMYAPIKTGEQIINEAKRLRGEGELAASIYEYIALYKTNTYGKEAYSTNSDIYKSLNNEKMAIECIRNAINLSKQDGMLHFKYAVILDDIGNEDASMDEFSKALEYSNDNKELLSALQNMWMARSVQDSTDSQALINLGAVLQKQNQFELAKAQYIKARQINPNDPVILINLASVYTALEDYDSAIRIYDEIISKNKGDNAAKFYKAKLYEKKGEIAPAIKEYREILATSPNNSDAQNSLNYLLSNLNGDQLLGYLLSEANKNPSSYDAQFKYAFEMHKNKKYLAAIEYYKKAIEINPKNEEPFINLAKIFIEQNENERAKNAINHGLSFMPENKNLLELKEGLEKQDANNIYAKGTELYNSGNYKEALEYYSKIPYQTPEIYTMIANCYYELKDNSNAFKYYNKVLETNPKNENALFMVANILITEKREDEAKRYLSQIVTMNPNNKEAKETLKVLNEGQESAMLERGIKFYEEKKFDDALAVLNKLTSRNPKNAYAYYYKGAVYEELKQADMALNEYKKSIQADANFSLGYYMAAVILDTKENYKEAVTYYDKFSALKAKEGVEDEFSQYAKNRSKELKDFLNQK